MTSHVGYGLTKVGLVTLIGIQESLTILEETRIVYIFFHQRTLRNGMIGHVPINCFMFAKPIIGYRTDVIYITNTTHAGRVSFKLSCSEISLLH